MVAWQHDKLRVSTEGSGSVERLEPPMASSSMHSFVMASGHDDFERHSSSRDRHAMGCMHAGADALSTGGQLARPRAAPGIEPGTSRT